MRCEAHRTRRAPTQYAFQLKAGDLNLEKWRETKLQVDQIRANGFGHPDFNRELPRRGVLVTTGVLKGAASGDAQEYAEDLVRTSWKHPGRPRGARS